VDDGPHNPDGTMENQTSFDLKTAIRDWRENLAQLPEFRTRDVDELESHVQDSIAELEGRGLSTEEAFVVATRRVGPGAVLAPEFARVNGQALWIDRGLWMVVGWAVISGFESMSKSTAQLAIIPTAFRLPVLPLLVWMLPLLASAILLRSLIRAEGIVPRVLGGLQWRPRALALTALGVGAFSLVLRFLSLDYITGNRVPRDLVVAQIMSFSEWLIAALIILVMARRKLRLAKA
jgi:hypothetical protein